MQPIETKYDNSNTILFVIVGGSYIIHEVFKINKHSNNVEVHEYGNWNPLEGLTVTEVDKWKRRGNLKRHHLR